MVSFLIQTANDGIPARLASILTIRVDERLAGLMILFRGECTDEAMLQLLLERLNREGNTYLNENFPRLDSIRKATTF